jgi:hypothetical protein
MSPWQVQISSNLISQGFWWSVRWTVLRTYPFTDGSQWEHGEFPWSYLIARGYQSPFGCLHSEDFWSFLLKSTYSGQSPINWALNEKLIYKMVDFQLPRLIAGGCVYIYIYDIWWFNHHPCHWLNDHQCYPGDSLRSRDLCISNATLAAGPQGPSDWTTGIQGS